MRRFSAAFIAALFVAGVSASAPFTTPASAAAAVPRVVFIVGPSAGSTGAYRAQARAAARIARQYTPDVVELYSPNATWTAVKRALTGASLVVYMGHGNGWPSHYRDALYPVSQNGFGLNPTVGSGDSAHQYFGEAAVGSQIRLAKNAVVLLHHLCYASGLSEPGLPEGSLDVGRQRVDNYAAGFVRAGAAAVIAEAWSSPSYFVRAILGGNRSIQAAWQSSPNANGNRIAFESRRSPGYVAQMDMETETSGFSRSVVMKAGLAPADVLAGARGSARGSSSFGPVTPSLASSGITLAAPTFTGLPVAGSASTIDVPFTIGNRTLLPAGLLASVRVEPIDVDTAPTTPTDPAPGDPGTTSNAGPPKLKRTFGPPSAGVTLIVAERPADVVAPVPISVGQASLGVPVSLPTTPGRYRVTITLHDPTGVAYDAATQALFPTLTVRVTGAFDGAIQAAPSIQVGPTEPFSLGLRVVNLGAEPWGHPAVLDPLSGAAQAPAAPAVVVGRWFPLSAGATIPQQGAPVAIPLPIEMAPGAPVETSLELTAPAAPGEYLIVLDVLTPEGRSLVASGGEPSVVRVTVGAGS